jgi:hypothetical protein
MYRMYNFFQSAQMCFNRTRDSFIYSDTRPVQKRLSAAAVPNSSCCSVRTTTATNAVLWRIASGSALVYHGQLALCPEVGAQRQAAVGPVVVVLLELKELVLLRPPRTARHLQNQFNMCACGVAVVVTARHDDMPALSERRVRCIWSTACSISLICCLTAQQSTLPAPLP